MTESHDARERRMRVTGPDTYGYYRTRCDCDWCGGPWDKRRDATTEFDRHICDERLPDGCVDGHHPDLVSCEIGAEWP